MVSVVVDDLLLKAVAALIKDVSAASLSASGRRKIRTHTHTH